MFRILLMRINVVLSRQFVRYFFFGISVINEKSLRARMSSQHVSMITVQRVHYNAIALVVWYLGGDPRGVDPTTWRTWSE